MSADFDNILNAMRANDSFWIASHIHPDPDAVGSQLAIARALKRMGKSVEIVGRDPVPRIARYLPGSEWMKQEPESSEMDALLIMDVSSLIRIGRQLIPKLQNHKTVLNIDHHPTGKPFADVACVRTEASATCEILYDLFQYADIEIDRDIAECLYAGIIGDTGNFRFSNTSPRCLEIAADLIRRGVQPHTAYEQIYGSRTEGQVRLLAMVLSTLERSENGLVGSMQVTQRMYDETNTTTEDVDGFIDYARSVEGVKAVAFVGELPDGRIKVSFRSRSDSVTVDGLAASFGGGGHVYAAGCLLEPPLSAAKKKAVDALVELVDSAEPASSNG